MFPFTGTGFAGIVVALAANLAYWLGLLWGVLAILEHYGLLQLIKP